MTDAAPNNAITNIYLRQVEVLIGPLQEYQGGATEKSIRFYGDGTQNGFRISFDIRKMPVGSQSNSLHLNIYNLSKGTRQAINRPGTFISVNVGYANTKLQTIFTGSIMGGFTKRSGADLVTAVLALSAGSAVVRAVASKTYGNGYTLKNIVADMARQFLGVTVDSSRIVLPNIPMGNQGWSTVGTVKSGLDQLSRVYGFSWSIQDGVFQAIDDTTALPSSLIISYKNGMLKRAEPILMDPFQKQIGVTIECILNPALCPGKAVTLESSVNDKLNGTYKICILTHSGDTHSDQWESRIENWMFDGFWSQ